MKSYYSKDLYSKMALLKAAYSFVDVAYIHLDSDEKNYIVEFIPKEETDINDFPMPVPDPNIAIPVVPATPNTPTIFPKKTNNK